MAGGVFGQAPLRLAVEASDWRTTTLLLAAAGAALGVAIWATVRDKWRGKGGLGNVLLGSRHRAAPSPDLADRADRPCHRRRRCSAFAGLWGVPFLEAAYGLPRTSAATLTSTLIAGWGVGAPVLRLAVGSHRPAQGAARWSGSRCRQLALAALVYVPGLPVPGWRDPVLPGRASSASAQIVCFALVKENHPGGAERHGDRLRQRHGHRRRRPVPAAGRPAARPVVEGPDLARRAHLRGRRLPAWRWARYWPVA